GGRVTVSGDAKVYVDISALTLAQADGSVVSLKLAVDSALAFNDADANVGWWDDSGEWRDTEYAFAYDADSGFLTMTIPEPSAFGLLAGTLALALCASRRRRRR
ncbi:MAG: PEP-CTERM sorting domain-containing protein, partial [Candidatus Spyradosoma sp.]